MNRSKDQVQEVLDQLSVLAPSPANVPRTAQHALLGVKDVIEAKAQRRWTRRLRLRLRDALAHPLQQPSAAVVLTILIAVAAFSFPVVRAAASDFLGLFRVQKFAAISVSPEQVVMLEQIAADGLSPGMLELLEEPGEPLKVLSLAEAEAQTGLQLRGLPTLDDPDELLAASGGSGLLTIDLEGVRGILSAAGVNPEMMPDDLDGQRVEITLFPTVEQRWENGVWLIQTEAPLVQYPEHLDPMILGKAALQVLGMKEEESSRLAQSLDWTSTLLLPIPQQWASFQEISVDGVSGLVLHSLDGSRSAILWQVDGMIYMLGGGTSEAVLSLAESIQ